MSIPWCLVSAMLAMVSAQISKVIWHAIRYRTFKPHLLVAAGGMPSAHASLVTSLAGSIALWDGIQSPAFAVSVVVGLIVIHDAHVVRYNAGRHASALNQIQTQLEPSPAIAPHKESLGHTKKEIVVGILFGLGVSFLISWLCH